MTKRVNSGIRLKEALRKRDMTQSELSVKTGISDSKISSYISGRYEPRPDGIEILSKALNVNPAWLAGFDVPMTDELPSYNNKSGILTIPFISQKLSAGVGIEHLSDADMDIKQIDILAEMARGVDKNSLVAARVKGDSMIDEHINSGDIAVFSRGLVNGEGIYVINYFGDVLIKRISYDPKTNTVSIISANRNYPTKTADAEDVLVLGKVVGVFHIMDI